MLNQYLKNVEHIFEKMLIMYIKMFNKYLKNIDKYLKNC